MKHSYRSAAGVPYRDYGMPHQTRPREVSRRERIKSRARWLQADFGLPRDQEASLVGDADHDVIREIRNAGAASGAKACGALGKF